jgi:pimeloyl-ACP methyl ester carboxylesterase
MSKKRALVLIHGIRTQADWMELLSGLFAEDFEVIPLRYGYFDLVRFLLPLIWLRRRPVDRIKEQIASILTLKDIGEVSVIAHSYGTWILSQILTINTNIKFSRIALCGSIIPRDFPWEKHCLQFGENADTRGHVVNDCGTRDPLPVVAESVTWGYGASGRFGFGNARVTDRFHNVGHSGFFTHDFAKQYWEPFFRRGLITSGLLDRPPAPLWLSLLGVLKLRYLIGSLIILLFAIGGGEFLRTTDDVRWPWWSPAEQMLANGIDSSTGRIRFGSSVSDVGKMLKIERIRQNMKDDGIDPSRYIPDEGEFDWGHLTKIHDDKVHPTEYLDQDVRYFWVPIKYLDTIKDDARFHFEENRCLDGSYMAFNFLHEKFIHVSIRIRADNPGCTEANFDGFFKKFFASGGSEFVLRGITWKSFISLTFEDFGGDKRPWRVIDSCQSDVLPNNALCKAH